MNRPIVIGVAGGSGSGKTTVVRRIVDTLGSPGFTTLPTQIGELMQRLGPLAQLAENAGGLFGAFRMPRPAASGSTASPPTAAPEPSPDHPAVRAVKKTEGSPPKKSSRKPAKASAAKKRSTKGATPAN